MKRGGGKHFPSFLSRSVQDEDDNASSRLPLKGIFELLYLDTHTGSAHTPIWDVAPSSGSESVKCWTTVLCPAHIHTERDRVYFDPDIVHSEAPFFSKVLGNRCGRGGGAGGEPQHKRWTDCLAARRGIVLLCTFFSLYNSFFLSAFFFSWTNNADIILQTLAEISFRPQSKF